MPYLEPSEIAETWLTLGDIPCESPIERRLARELVPHAERWGFKVYSQFKLGPYRYDFAIIWDDNVVALVECDGREYHSTPAQIARDAAKDQVAKDAGLHLFRCTGTSIHRDAWKCAEAIIFSLWPPRCRP